MGTSPSHASGRRLTFKQVDLVRAIKSAQAAGLTVARIEISPNGKISVIIGELEDVLSTAWGKKEIIL